MDLQAVRQSFEQAGFAQRDALAQGFAAEASPQDLVAIASFLVHEHPAVRLGTIEVLRHARFAPAVGALRAVVDSGKGDERVFALRALTAIATPEHKDKLLARLQVWLKDSDPHVVEHARALFMALKGQAQAEGPPVPVPVAVELFHPDQATRRAALVNTLKNHPEPAAALARALTETRSDVVRMDLAGGLGMLPAGDIAKVAPQALGALDADGVALLTRTLQRKLGELDRETLAPVGDALERARARHAEHPLVTEAVDAALVALLPKGGLKPLLLRLHQLTPAGRAALGQKLKTVAKGEALGALDGLIAGLRHAPLALLHMAEGIAALEGALLLEQRAHLRHIAQLALTHEGAAGPEGAVLRVEVARLLTAISQPGEVMPETLAVALLDSADDESHRALLRLCEKTATEQAANTLIRLLERGSPTISGEARGALSRFVSSEVEVVARGEGFAVLPRFRTLDGERLEVMGGAMRSVSGDAYALGEDGQVVPVRSTPFGGCRCCLRPRALATFEGERPTCPVTGAPHLIDGGKTVLERQHPLGGCGACDSPRPLIEDKGTVSCPACGTPHVMEGGRYVPTVVEQTQSPPPEPDAFGDSSPLQGTVPTDLPLPPSVADLDRTLPIVRDAMSAHVFFVDDKEHSWVGSGVIIDVADDRACVLTHRHLFDGGASPQAYTVQGRLVSVRPLWTASHDLDAAVVEIPLGGGRTVSKVSFDEGQAFVGSTVFAVGGPNGVSWSYVTGTISAFRELETEQGLLLKLLQTQLPLPPGAQGGALYHERGHLVGLLSFSRRVPLSGAQAVYALNVGTIRDALLRDEVTFQGRLLADGTEWSDPLAES